MLVKDTVILIDSLMPDYHWYILTCLMQCLNVVCSCEPLVELEAVRSCDSRSFCTSRDGRDWNTALLICK